MADTGKNSPLGINVTGDYMYDTGFNINPVAESFMGVSKRNAAYSFGSCVSDTCLRMLTWAINDAYNRGVVLKSPAGTSVYDNLIAIGNGTIPALGNSMPPTYVPVDPANLWARTSVSATALSYAEQYARQAGYTNALPGPATTGYGNYDGSYGDPLQGKGVTDQKQNATWYPYNMTNPNHSVTQWGYIRLHALQAWNEFNWNGTVVDPSDGSVPSYLQGYQLPEYKEFLSSITSTSAYIDQANQAIIATNNGNTFLEGTYSNMNDLISADITGVSLSTVALGADLENLGMALDLTNIDSFGLPSNLLRTLGSQGAITQDLSLVLLASGLTSPEISQISSGEVLNPTEEQERKIYGAFLLMTGENLRAILAPIQCRTQGLQTLADLLDVKKLFPNSYATLTVPMYNATPGPTNSKTYYLIYTDGTVNPALNLPAMREYVGTLVPKGNPPLYDSSTTPKNYREVPKGFDSYLSGILPTNQALAAGALSFTLRQVKSVETFDIKQFAKVVTGIENVSDLPQTAGTSKPTNQQMINQSTTRGALGSGPNGTYTMSDLFGCMTGLPYPWKLIKQRLNQLETKKLYNIYNQLFLAVTWEGASVTVIPETREVEISPGIFQTEYRVGSLVINDSGGGYGRGTASDPVITCDNGGAGIGIVGRNDALAASLGGGTFGRVNSATVTNKGSWQLTPPTASIQYPPTTGLPVASNGDIATDGLNTSYGTTGWPQPMNQVVSAYILQANQEITSILNAKPELAKFLNTYWSGMGSQLMIEQRTRFKALTPVAVPKDYFASPYPSATHGFTDSLPQYSKDTRPHMAAQTIEAMSDMNTVGGQSTIGLMRQERNQARLQLLGIDQDNNVPDDLSDTEKKILTTNGTAPLAINGTGVSGPLGEYTLPAWPYIQMPDGTIVTPSPSGTYSSDSPIQTPDGTVIFPNSSSLPADIGSPSGQSTQPTGFQLKSSAAPGDITPILEGDPNPVVAPIVPVGPVISTGPFGPTIPLLTAQVNNPTGVNNIAPNINSDTTLPIIIQPAPEYDPTNLPSNLDPKYTNSTMMPAVPSIQEAIDRVIECNCDCWIA